MYEGWQPLSARETAPVDLRDGPTLLETKIRRSIRYCHLTSAQIIELYENLNIACPLSYDGLFTSRISGSREDALYELAYETPVERLLEIADYLLAHPARRGKLSSTAAYLFVGDYDYADLHATFKTELREALDEAGSVYQVNEDNSGLERRAHPYAVTLLNTAEKAASIKTDAGSAGQQLRAANDALRASKPDPARAYSLAIKAVESAAHAIVEPTNTKATLGSMRGLMRSNPSAFEVAIPWSESKCNIDPVVQMITLLWEGQSSRHGARTPTIDESRDAAEMAVQLASILVLWFTTGLVRQKIKQGWDT